MEGNYQGFVSFFAPASLRAFPEIAATFAHARASVKEFSLDPT